MKRYYYSKLTNIEQECYQKLLKAIANSDSIVKFPCMNSVTIKNIVTAVNFDYPELFFVDFQHFSFLGDRTSVKYQLKYYVQTTVRQRMIDKVEQKVKEILTMLDTQKYQSDYEKCRWIHNYLVKNVSYNYDALKNWDNYPNSFEITGVFIDKLAVCEGISKAFKLLCDRLGISTYIVVGTSYLQEMDTEILHTWNIVKLEGEYSHIDVTWDIGLSQSSKCMRFDYFCLSDKYMKLDHKYQELPECKTDKFSYFYRRNRCFANGKQLQVYLESELKNGSCILYFKVEINNRSVEFLQAKIQEQVNKTVAMYYNYSCSMQVILNKKQLCFFFRIIR